MTVFIIAQIFGIFGMTMNVVSYQSIKQKNIILLQLFGSLFFTVNMFLLNAEMGGLLNLIGFVRAVVYSNKDKIKNIGSCNAIFIFLYVLLDINIALKVIIPFLVLSVFLLFFDKDKYNIESFSFVMFSLIFIGTVFSYLVLIRDIDINLFICMFLITILTDTFAYIGGKMFGKHKLIPKVSPNKTIEGSIIGSVFGTIIPSIFYLFMVDPGKNFIVILLVVFVLSILGQIGDLFFSSIKRYYGIKDYSNIMPGHGGVLDRLDSIIFVTIGYILIMSL